MPQTPVVVDDGGMLGTIGKMADDPVKDGGDGGGGGARRMAA